MSIIFVDRNRELVDTIDALGLCITSASDYFQLAREVVNPVLMTASNPMWTFGGGIDAAFRREFPELVEKKMETGGDMDRLGNICFCVTVDGELNASRELVEKALAFAKSKTGSDETLLVHGAGTGIGGLSLDDFAEAFKSVFA